MVKIVGVLVTVAMLAQAGVASAGNGSGGTLNQVGYGAGSFLGTLVYAPFKSTFCILGGLGSLPALAAGPDTAGRVARASCTGTWVISPSVLRGQEELRFVGNTRETPSRLAGGEQR
jgi:hypothetical protein